MHQRISELREDLRHGRIGRRDFIRYAMLLGLSLGVAEAMSACAPKPTATPEPTVAALPTALSQQVPTPLGQNVVPTIPAEWLSTPVPTATLLPTAPAGTLTTVPLYQQGATWSCPGCTRRFATEQELLEHVRTEHARRIPGIHKPSQPAYAQFMVGKVERFDQKNIVFSRVMWDQEYQKRLAEVKQQPRRETPEEAARGAALAAGAIYVDARRQRAPQVPGLFAGHLEDVSGLFSWDDPVSPKQMPVSDPAEMAAEIKQAARFYGADLVGITQINPLWVYSHRYERETGNYEPLEVSYKYAIVMGIEMKWDEINQSPGYGASAATALAYSQMPFVAAALAKYIRTLGYAAVPSGNDTTQSVPLAIDAGLGEWGRQGLLLTPEFGPRQRLCKVYTDLPLATDQPIEFGMVDFCATCRMCAGACPARAIPFGDRDTKPTSISNRPGFLRWYVDVAKCYLFWRANGGVDCSNCIAACPWSFAKRPWI